MLSTAITVSAFSRSTTIDTLSAVFTTRALSGLFSSASAMVDATVVAINAAKGNVARATAETSEPVEIAHKTWKSSGCLGK